MTKIILPKELTLKDSPFFDQILQASSRGDVLIWNDDYTKATLTLSTDAFFTDNDAKAIIEKGGEVEGYAYWTKINKSDFENNQISDELSVYLNSSNENDSELDLQTILTIKPTYEETFKFVRPIMVTNENGEEVESDELEYLNSANNEYLPMSLTLAE